MLLVRASGVQNRGRLTKSGVQRRKELVGRTVHGEVDSGPPTWAHERGEICNNKRGTGYMGMLLADGVVFSSVPFIHKTIAILTPTIIGRAIRNIH